ncbi:MAG: PTS sugar transporter subunit IIA [Acidobacteriota bacterium]|jgi:PTS system mannose-specific IIA component
MPIQEPGVGPIVGGVVVTHGNLAAELVNAAEMIVRDLHHITAVTIGWHDTLEEAREQISQAIERVDQGAGVVVLTDMFGGTPTNIACTFLGNTPVEVVTGVNLPMIIRMAEQQPGENLLTLAKRVRDQGQKNIYLASEVLVSGRQS